MWDLTVPGNNDHNFYVVAVPSLDAQAKQGYGSCRSLPWHLVGVGVPALVGVAGAVLVVASP
jgi:hypothetical protein